MRSSPALDTLNKWLGYLVGLLAFLGSAAVVFLTLVTVVAVFWRYVLNDPIFGIEDLSTMGLTVAVAGAIAYGASRGSHISVNVLTYFVGRSVTPLHRYRGQGVLGVGIIGFCAYALAVKGQLRHQMRRVHRQSLQSSTSPSTTCWRWPWRLMRCCSWSSSGRDCSTSAKPPTPMRSMTRTGRAA